jgi:hypothetical protein
VIQSNSLMCTNVVLLCVCVCMRLWACVFVHVTVWYLAYTVHFLVAKSAITYIDLDQSNFKLSDTIAIDKCSMASTNSPFYSDV